VSLWFKSWRQRQQRRLQTLTTHAWVCRDGVMLRVGSAAPVWLEGEPLVALAQALATVGRHRWLPAPPLSVTFGFPFARDFIQPWPDGLCQLKDYQAFLTQALPVNNDRPEVWHAGFALPAWGASAYVWALPESDYQALCTLCRQLRLRLDAVHTPLSASLATYRRVLPDQAGLLVLDHGHVHCAVLQQGVVCQVFAWPFPPERALIDSLQLAATLAEVSLPCALFVAGARPDSSDLWDGVTWLESSSKGESA
jgi:hypothetical protein